MSHSTLFPKRGVLRQSREHIAYGGHAVDNNLPETLNALVWFDFSDPATITVEGGGPPTSQGQLLDTIQSKGVDTSIVYSTSEVRSPMWDLPENHGISPLPMAYFDAKLMLGDLLVDIERPYSFMAVVAADELGRPLDNFYFTLGSTFNASIYLMDEDEWSINTVGSSVAAVEDLTMAGMIMTRDAVDNSLNWYNLDAGGGIPETLGAVDPGPIDIEMGAAVGAEDIIGMKGWLAEYAIFEGELDEGAVLQLQNYIHRKWGVAWA